MEGFVPLVDLTSIEEGVMELDHEEVPMLHGGPEGGSGNVEHIHGPVGADVALRVARSVPLGEPSPTSGYEPKASRDSPSKEEQKSPRTSLLQRAASSLVKPLVEAFEQRAAAPASLS